MFSYIKDCHFIVQSSALLLALPIASTSAEVITVDDDGKADFASIQAAVDYASDGDEILVAPGVYTEDDQRPHVVDLLGKVIILRATDGPDVTFIDGEQVRRGIVCYLGETSETRINGFTIQNCFAIDSEFERDGVIRRFDNGGGMLNWESNPTLEQCRFTNNITTDIEGLSLGGAMYNWESSPALTDCSFNGNSVKGNAGGMANYLNSKPILIRCTFTNNSAIGQYGSGGGMWNHRNSSPTLTDCKFTNNAAEYNAGGMHNRDGSSSPTLTDTTVCGNTPDQMYGSWVDNGGNAIATSCDCPTDINGDGVINGADLTFLFGFWGSNDAVADVNNDGVVDGADLTVVLDAWGACSQ